MRSVALTSESSPCSLCLCGEFSVRLGESVSCALLGEVRVVFDAEAGAVLADADVEDADDAEPAEQVDRIE